jgi:RNA polymerase sigma-70 factor (ECF subfamily)
MEALDDNGLLIEIGQQRNRTAADSLFLRYEKRLYGMALTLGCDRALAEEAVQESLLEIWRSAPRYRPGNPFAWIMRIAARAAIHAARKDKRQPAGRNAMMEEPRDMEAVAAADAAERRELYEALRRGLNALPETERKVVTLHYVGSLTQEEIGAELAVSHQAVSKMIARALESLRARLAQAGFAGAALAALGHAIADAACEGVQAPTGLHARVMDALRDRAAAPAAAAPPAIRRSRAARAILTAGGAALIATVAAFFLADRSSNDTLAPERGVTVSDVAGAGAEVRRAGREAWMPLDRGESLRAGDRARTRPGGEVTLAWDEGGSLLMREESDLEVEPIGDPRASAAEGRTRRTFRISSGAIVCDLKNPGGVRTNHASIAADKARFFLIVAHGKTAGSPWGFSRLDVTEGHAQFAPSSRFTTPTNALSVPAGMFAAAGADPEGKPIETSARKSDGRELSPAYGGRFYRETARQYRQGGLMLNRYRDGASVATLRGDALVQAVKTVGAPVTVTPDGECVVRSVGPDTEHVDVGLPPIPEPVQAFAVEILSKIKPTASSRTQVDLYVLPSRSEFLPAGLPPMTATRSRSQATATEPHGVRLVRMEFARVGQSERGWPVIEGRTLGGRHLWQEKAVNAFGFEFRDAELRIAAVRLIELAADDAK